MATIQLKRGVKSQLPNTGMSAGEPLFTTDKGTLYIATNATTKLPVVPAIDALSAVDVVASDDLLIIQDTSTDLVKNITFSNFKTALNIPTGSSDEKVSIMAGGTAGYLGTTGSDGILRVGASLNMTKDVGDEFVTLSVASIDGGSFV